MASPKLRFKEFAEDWSSVTLEDLAEVERGKFSVRPRNDPRYFGGEMPFVQTGDVTGSDVYLRGFTQTLNEDGIRVSKVFPADTILITIAANIGDTTITQYPVACPDSVVAIQPKQDKANTIFLKNIIDLQKDNLDSQATQNAQKNINLQVLKPLELIVPSKEEQTKIASFFSAVDEKISQLTQKHQLLSQYKQGMMQKLFSQQIRFKADDGSEFGEWAITLIKNAVSFIKDGTHGTHQDDPSSNLFLLSAKNLQNGKIVTDEKDRKINQKEFDSIYKNYKLKDGDILLSVVGTIGRVAIFKDDYESYAFQRSVAFMRFKKALPEFIYQLFLAKDFQNELLVRQVVSAQPGIYLGDLSKIEIKLPCLEEQTKIANCLSAIDQKIEKVAQQIEETKQWKKGLLQQMFV